MQEQHNTKALDLIEKFFDLYNNQEELLKLTKQAVDSGLDVNCTVTIKREEYSLYDATILHHAVYNNLDKVVKYLLSLKTININAVARYRESSDLRVINIWRRRCDTRQTLNGLEILKLLLEHGAYVPDKLPYIKSNYRHSVGVSDLAKDAEQKLKEIETTVAKYSLLKLLGINQPDIHYYIMSYTINFARTLIIQEAPYNPTAAVSSAIKLGCTSTIKSCCYSYLSSHYNSPLPDRWKIFDCALASKNEKIIESVIIFFNPRIAESRANTLIANYNWGNNIKKIILDNAYKTPEDSNPIRAQAER